MIYRSYYNDNLIKQYEAPTDEMGILMSRDIEPYPKVVRVEYQYDVIHSYPIEKEIIISH